MLAHEAIGLLVATVVAVAFVTAVTSPSSQMSQLLQSSTAGWANVLTAIRGGTTGAAA